MPTISMFYGILVSMYVLDTQKHHLPHIHIRYAEFKAVSRYLQAISSTATCRTSR